MANRPVFVVNSKSPFYKIVNINFKWSSGFAKSQSQKNILYDNGLLNYIESFENVIK